MLENLTRWAKSAASNVLGGPKHRPDGTGDLASIEAEGEKRGRADRIRSSDGLACVAAVMAEVSPEPELRLDDDQSGRYVGAAFWVGIRAVTQDRQQLIWKAACECSLQLVLGRFASEARDDADTFLRSCSHKCDEVSSLSNDRFLAIARWVVGPSANDIALFRVATRLVTRYAMVRGYSSGCLG